MKYLLKLADCDCFECVDQYTFDNYRKAVDDDGNSRYKMTDYVILYDDGKISISLDNANSVDLARLVRALELPAAVEVKGGFVREPEIVKFKARNKLEMRELKTGETWKKVA